MEPRVEAITSTATWEAYDVAVNRLGSFAIVDYGGSNILFPENESERVWIDQAPQQSFTIPNEAAWVAKLLDEIQAYTVNEPSVSANVEQVDGRSHYTIHITNSYNVPIPAEMNTLGQTMIGDEINIVLYLRVSLLVSGFVMQWQP